MSKGKLIIYNISKTLFQTCTISFPKNRRKKKRKQLHVRLWNFMSNFQQQWQHLEHIWEKLCEKQNGNTKMKCIMTASLIHLNRLIDNCSFEDLSWAHILVKDDLTQSCSHVQNIFSWSPIKCLKVIQNSFKAFLALLF